MTENFNRFKSDVASINEKDKINFQILEDESALDQHANATSM
jgi:hypothetical protein